MGRIISSLLPAIRAGGYAGARCCTSGTFAPMDIRITGQHVLVCGSTQGIGLAVAHELSSLGARVNLLARDPGRLEKAAHGLPRG
ncbi:MAG: SDR family NAD(P)-dependent oxidoreductase, partial [Flavobacteriales bacterium]|nr:SDR family NAD(P)-dependent oxidoreductase [Flavobacteriales bacterium]